MKQQKHLYHLFVTIALIFVAFFPPPARAATIPCNPGLICSAVYAPVFRNHRQQQRRKL
ncbi:MAG: hypothetical protein HGA96_02270 [Desulfobulbaceae bacterium]|nr:hypothetical protein [Desulfobulbaceae bacterium]